ncbi:hypothetical protein [Gorillibacterium sp. CAU 1737]|uniref:hypothetical protein n=1 Tax=Gorillibacterium sp. CAU 1737 TaxID=3140362 RepID=UPI003260DDBB
MGHFGFSYIGLLFLLMLFIPNLLWTKFQPEGYSSTGEDKLLSLLEKVGQAGVTGIALLFSDFNLRPWSPWSFWLVFAFLMMILYELWWIRYFTGNRSLSVFYSSYWGVPVAGATLPVLAFFLLGIYGKVIWMLLAVALLGIGHIGIHLQHRKALNL